MRVSLDATFVLCVLLGGLWRWLESLELLWHCWLEVHALALSLVHTHLHFLAGVVLVRAAAVPASLAPSTWPPSRRGGHCAPSHRPRPRGGGGGGGGAVDDDAPCRRRCASH